MKHALRRADRSTDHGGAPWTAFRVGWMVIILVTVSIRAYTLSSWSWFQDDFVFVVGVDRLSFVNYVFQDYNSHLQPGQFLIVWLATRLDPLNFALAILVTCVFVVSSLVTWGLALREIFGERLHVLAALVLLGMSPILLGVSLWWAAALSIYTLYTWMGLSIWFLARYLLRGQRRRDLLGVTLAYAVALVFWQKALLVTVPLFFLVLLLGPRERRASARTALVALTPIALLSVAYVICYVAVPRPGAAVSTVTAPRGRGISEVADFYVHGILDVLLPALLGGPFNTLSSANGTYTPASGSLSLVLWGFTVMAVVVGILYRRRGWLAVLMSATYAALSWGLILFSYRYDQSGVFAIRAGRYTADLLPVALLTVMFLITPLRTDAPASVLRRPVSDQAAVWLRRGRLGYLALVTVVALALTGRSWDQTAPSSPEPWFSAFTHDVAALSPGTPLIDNPTPEQVLSPTVFGDAARQSFVLEPLTPTVRFNQPGAELAVADPSGHLFVGELVTPAATALPGPDGGCGYAVRTDQETRIPLTGELFHFGWVVEITYFVQTEADIVLQVGDSSISTTLVAPAAGEITRQQVYVADAITDVTISQTAGDNPICVTEVRIGEIAPGPRRPPGLETTQLD